MFHRETYANTKVNEEKSMQLDRHACIIGDAELESFKLCIISGIFFGNCLTAATSNNRVSMVSNTKGLLDDIQQNGHQR